MKIKLEPGDWFVKCDRTGFKVPASQTKKEWNGLIVWERVYESRHPQDFVRGVPDNQSVPFARPTNGADVFLDTNEVQADDL